MVAIKSLFNSLMLGSFLFIASTVNANVVGERASIDTLTGDSLFEDRAPLELSVFIH